MADLFDIAIARKLSGGGGGGSSDLSAANVTMVFSGDAGIFLPELYDFDPPIGGLTSALSIVYRAGDDQNGTYKVALYKGKLLLLSDNQYFADTVSVTGDAIYDPEYPDNAAIIISGDCTITLS